MNASNCMEYLRHYDAEHAHETVLEERYFVADCPVEPRQKPKKTINPVIVARARLYSVGDDVPRFSLDGRVLRVRANCKPTIVKNMLDKTELGMYFPEVLPFIGLQMCDRDGVPRFLYENTMRYIKGHDKPKYIRLHLRTTEEETERICSELVAINRNEPELMNSTLDFLLDTLGIRQRWKAEADAYMRLIKCERMS